MAAAQKSDITEGVESARPAIEAELLRRFGWKPDLYSLQGKELDGETKVLVIYVVHVDDVRNPIPGGGKSWRVDYDLGQKVIVRWLKFQ